MLIKSYFKFAYCAELVFIVAHAREILFHQTEVLMISRAVDSWENLPSNQPFL